MIDELRKVKSSTWLELPIRSWGDTTLRVTGPPDHVLDFIVSSTGQDRGDVADKILGTPNLGRYLLIDTIAQTRASTIFTAVDQVLGRAVALKLHHARAPLDRRRALYGGRAMARLDHPNVVRVYDLGEHEGWLYSTMELCDADSSAWAPGKRWADVLERLIEAGRGLQAVHAAGLVHGDVKPANILIKADTAKLGDLGLATSADWDMWTRGSAGYIAPEAGSGQAGIASDVFAFACTIWASIYGSPPGSDEAHAHAVRSVVVGGRVPELSRSLLPALEPRPEDRMSLAELLALLESLRSLESAREIVAQKVGELS